MEHRRTPPAGPILLFLRRGLSPPATSIHGCRRRTPIITGAGRATFQDGNPDVEVRTFPLSAQRTLTQLLDEWRSAERDWEAAVSEEDAAAAVGAARRVATAWVAYQDAVGAFPGSVLQVAGDDGHYVAANQAAAETLGYALSELESMSVRDLAGGDSLPVVEDEWRGFLDVGRANGTFTLRTRTGQCIAVDFDAHARSPIPPLHTSVLTPRA